MAFSPQSEMYETPHIASVKISFLVFVFKVSPRTGITKNISSKDGAGFPLNKLVTHQAQFLANIEFFSAFSRIWAKGLRAPSFKINPL